MVASPPSKTLHSTVEVDLGSRTYPIYIGEGILREGDLLRKHVTSKRALVITNDRVGPLYLDETVAVLREGGVQVETVVLPDGEEYKSMEVLMKIMEAALTHRMDRTCTFVALGGGVIGDMVGFAAAIYQRGVKFVQVPTTLMAMVDSAVGGKTAVNHPLGKNMIGAFYQPQAVIADMATLRTLPDRELASGIAEVVKYGLIRDAAFFEWQEARVGALRARDAETLSEAVRRSCENKAAVVAADEREAGLRATLNLGHTFGHAIETGLGYGALLHGEAVAIGTHMAAVMSAKLGWIDAALAARAVALLRAAALPVELPRGGGMTPAKFEAAMALDKKVSEGELRLVLLRGPLGGCVFTGEYDAAAMRETIAEFCARQ
ncbi:3-Dehydroquinate synthase [Tribonema minus]|uniref:3-dehydroquinate synthase n=1 Tax=Tribonema minus TaxID=303371 RepID=A0A835Z318_9STRA|nr:3-Dehydroquinate synthase [Tribonema minus]